MPRDGLHDRNTKRTRMKTKRTLYQSSIYSPTDALVICLKKKNNIKMYIKIYVKTAPTRFGVTVTPSPGSAFPNAVYRLTLQHTDTNKNLIYVATPPPY